MGYARSLFPDFESYLRVVVDLDEEDIQFVLGQYNSNFDTCRKTPGIYSIKDVLETVYTMGDHEGTLQNEYVDISMKTKFILPRFRGTSGTFRFDQKSLVNSFLGFTLDWDYKPTNAIHADS